MILTVYLEATPRFELGNQGFADPCLTTWLCRLISVSLDLGKRTLNIFKRPFWSG